MFTVLKRMSSKSTSKILEKINIFQTPKRPFSSQPFLAPFTKEMNIFADGTPAKGPVYKGSRIVAVCQDTSAAT